jgi:hypothetical protein
MCFWWNLGYLWRCSWFNDFTMVNVMIQPGRNARKKNWETEPSLFARSL